MFGYSVLIRKDFDDFASLFNLLIKFCFDRYIKHSRQCFTGYPDTSNFVTNTLLRVIFSTLFLTFGYPNETLSSVFDILHQTSWGYTVEQIVMQGTLWPTGLIVEDSAMSGPSLIAGWGHCVAFLGKSLRSQTVRLSSQVYIGDQLNKSTIWQREGSDNPAMDQHPIEACQQHD